MKKKRINLLRKENGAITVLTAVLLTALVAFMALSVDFGLHYYSGAKLQNAVDSAATAVAAGLGSADTSLEDKAYEYLTKNGYDRDGKYKDKIKVTVERKGYLDLESVDNDEDCISTGYYKVTAEVEDSTLFARILDVDSMHLKKVAYVRCEADYVAMPEALKYTVFAGSTRGTAGNPALEINGRTGATINEITASFEGLINNINSKIVQPIIGIFGGNPNYNTLVHINLSEVITDGDVHSNSNISIGVQALNASRVKDHDFDSGNADYDNNEEANNETTTDEDNEIDDYGQVTYTAVTDILFNSSLKRNHDDSTHLYVQNRQYLEQTQLALNIIDQIDFSKVSSTNTLRNEYSKVGEYYLGKLTSNFISSSQKQAVMDQQYNLFYDTAQPNHYRLENQRTIVYNVSQKTAEDYLAEVVENGYDALQAEFEMNGIDEPFVRNTETPLYENIADTKNNINYGIKFTEKDSDQVQSFTVTGSQINRDLTNIKNGNRGAVLTGKTNTGAKFAIARTFQQNSDYIDVPNMKPYFVRQVNSSVRNATQTREELSDSAVTGDKNVKYAVKTMTDELQGIVNNTDYVDPKYAQLDDNGNVTSFKTGVATGRLFEDFKIKESSEGVVDLSTPYTYATTDWTLGDTGHTDSPYYSRTWTVSKDSFKGYNIYNSENTLKTPTTFVNEFADEHINLNANGESDYGKGAINKYYNKSVAVDNDHSNYLVTDYEKHYGNEAVLKKKNNLKANASYNSVKNRFGQFSAVAPDPDDVFLRSSGAHKFAFDSAMQTIRNSVDDDGLSQGSTATVARPTITVPDTTYAPGLFIPSLASPTIFDQTNTYYLENLVNGSDERTITSISSVYQGYKNNMLSGYPANTNGYTWKGDEVSRKDVTLGDNCAYGNVAPKDLVGNYHHIRTNPGSRVYVTGTITLGKNSSTDVWLDVGYQANSSSARTYLFVDGDINVSTGNKVNGFHIYPNTTVICKGNVTVNGGSRFCIDDGGILVTLGTLDCSRIEATAGSIICANKINKGNADNSATLGNVFCGTDLDFASDLTIQNNANVFVAGSLIMHNNKTLTLGSNSRLAIQGTVSGFNAFNCNSNVAMATNGMVSLQNDFTINNDSAFIFESLAILRAINNNGSLFVGTLASPTSIINNGAMYLLAANVTGNIESKSSTASFSVKNSLTAVNLDASDKTIYCGSLNLSGKLTATLARVEGDATCGDISCYVLKVDGNLTISAISYVGNLEVVNTLTLNGDISLPNAPIKAGAVNCTGKLTNNYNLLYVTGLLTSANLENNGTFVTGGGVTVTGNLTNGSSANTNATIFTDGKITVNGNLVNYGKIASTATGNAIVVGGNTNNFANAIIYTAAGDFKTQDLTLNKNSEFSISGEIRILGLLINNTDLNINGGLAAQRIQNNATIYSNSSLTLAYLKNSEGASFACNGDLHLTGAIDGKSLYNEGKCYINGDVTAVATVYVDKGILYVFGDLVGANNASAYGIDNALWINNHSKVYINGYIDSNSSDIHIWLQNGTANGSYSGAPRETVLSVYGYHNLASRTCIGPNISTLCNQQTGATLYLGTGASTGLSAVSGLITLNGLSALDNAGTIYSYGNMYLPNANAVNLYNNGATYIAGYLTASNASINVYDGHTFICYKELTAKKISATNGKVYLLGQASITENITLAAGSEFYVSEGSTVDVSRISCDSSTLYLPRQSGAIDFNNSIRNNSGLVTDSDVNFTANVTIPSGVTVYVGGTTTVSNNATITNNGNMYLVGTVNLSNASHGSINVEKYYDAGAVKNKYNYKNNPAAFVFGASGDSYIGPIVDSNGTNGTYTTNAMFKGEGNVYIENSVKVCGYYGGAGRSNGEDYADYAIGNRLTSVAVRSGKTCISGDIIIADSSTKRSDQAEERQGGVKIFEGTSLSCGGKLEVATTIYNYGKLYVLGNLVTHNGNYCTDRDYNGGKNNMHTGFSLKNGVCDNDSSSPDTTGAVMYVGGSGVVDFYGYVRNSGKVFFNGSLNVQGWGEIDGINGDNAYQNFIGAQTHVNGYIHLNSNQLVNRETSIFACNGELKFGGCIFNCGTIVATGDVTNNETQGVDTVNNVSYRNSSYKSIVNGAYKINYNDYYKCVFKDALLYCGGNMQLGKSHTGGEAGSYISYGTTYVGGDMKEYTSKGNSFFSTALWLMNDTDTFIGGNCFGGGGIVTGANSIFMCGGDFESKRSTKINIQTMNMYYVDVGHFVTCVDNDNNKRKNKFNYSPAYFYVGGNMFANVLGKTLYNRTDTLSTQVPENCSRDLDIYSNTNMYVGGSMYANGKIYLKENVNLIVAHQKELSQTSMRFLFDLQSMDPGNFTLEGAFLDAIKLISDSGTRSALISLSKAADYFNLGTKYAFYTPNEYHCSILGNVIVNGHGHIGNNAVIKDMTKTYFYGNLSCAGYMQLGQALDGNDETEAKEVAYRKHGDSDGDTYNQAHYENAAYMYVGGDYKSSGYTREYASTTMRVKGDFTATSIVTGSLELKHDATIYVGKKLKANGIGIEKIRLLDIIRGTQDLKNLAYGIRGSAYSHFYVNGSMQATMSSIIIKDASEVVVNGNMTALSHIRLGEAGDYARQAAATGDTSNTAHCGKVENNNFIPCCDNCTDNKDCQCNCKDCIWCKQPTECNCCDKCTNDEFCECGCETCICISGGSSGDGGVTGDGELVDEGETVNTENELAYDNTDMAVGGKFYVGGKLVTYTGHIQEFAFSRLAVGEYVFTPKYITLRHNADMWVMPETFKNVTYRYVPYVSESDGSFLGNLIDKIREIGYNIKETFKPKNGSIYTLGELTLNKNASLMGTYDATVLGQCVLRPDSLIYLGHNFDCSAPSANISLDLIKGNTSVVGFDTYGSAGDGYKCTCPNKATVEHSKKYSMVMEASKYDPSMTYHCDRCGAAIPASNIKRVQVSHPVVVYADNEINISTTVDMKLTYLVANRGDVNLYDIYSKSDNVEQNAKELPNAICSYQKDVNYFAMYSKIGALFYAPAGNVDLDGWYMEIWGSIIGNTVDMNTYYLALHRFTNWRTMDLHIPESGLVYLIPESMYNDAEDNVDDIYLFDPREQERTGADLFFFERVSS